LAEGNTELAQQRMEEIICLAVASLTAMTHLPVQDIECLEFKRQVATLLSQTLCKEAAMASDYLLMLIHPTTCPHVIKVSYPLFSLTTECRIPTSIKKQTSVFFENYLCRLCTFVVSKAELFVK
jgi:hypothetical protein